MTQQTEDQENVNDDEMKMLFEALIRKSIQKCKKWVFPAPLITDLFSLEKSSVRYTSVP